MEDYQRSRPLSPNSAALFSLFTNLYDDTQNHTIDTNISYLRDPKQTDCDASLQVHVRQQTPKSSSHSYSGQRKRNSNIRNTYANMPGYNCFSAATGELTRAPKRSAFSEERRKEVKQLRRLGACLRCKFRKITCSGGDPCEPCRAMAQGKIGSRALIWMECIRPSFKAVTIFNKVDLRDHRSRLDEIKGSILGLNDPLVISAPFELTLESTTRRLIQWISEGSNHSQFSIIGLLRSDKLSKILTSALGSNLSENFRLMVYLTNDVTTRGAEHAYYGYNAATLHMASHHAGNIVLNAVQSRLRPIVLAESRTKLNDLRAIFLVLFGISVTARSSYIDALLRGQTVTSGFKERVESFIRLVNHYIVYISGFLIDTDADSHSSLMATCKFQWDNPGSSVRSLTHDYSDKGLEVAGNNLVAEYISPLESTGVQPLATCDTCGSFGSTLDYEGRCQKCHLDFGASDFNIMLDGQIDQRALAKLGDREHANAAGLLNNDQHQNPSHYAVYHSSLPQYENSCTVGHYYPEGEDPRKSLAFITSAGARRWDLQKDEGVTKMRCSPQKYGRRYGHEAIQKFFVPRPYHDESSPNYWTFFNQNEQFEIHSKANKRAFINRPRIIYPTELIEGGRSTKHPKLSFGQPSGMGAFGPERVSGSQVRAVTSYTTSTTSTGEVFTNSQSDSSLHSASTQTQVQCMWCEKTASTLNNNELCDECNKLLNPKFLESQKLDVPTDFLETGQRL